MTPQSKRKATPEEDLDCVPDTEHKGDSALASADTRSNNQRIRQPCFGAPLPPRTLMNLPTLDGLHELLHGLSPLIIEVHSSSYMD